MNAVRESIYVIHIVTDDDRSLKIEQLDESTDSQAYLEIAQVFSAVGANKQSILSATGRENRARPPILRRDKQILASSVVRL